MAKKAPAKKAPAKKAPAKKAPAKKAPAKKAPAKKIGLGTTLESPDRRTLVRIIQSRTKRVRPVLDSYMIGEMGLSPDQLASDIDQKFQFTDEKHFPSTSISLQTTVIELLGAISSHRSGDGLLDDQGGGPAAARDTRQRLDRLIRRQVPHINPVQDLYTMGGMGINTTILAGDINKEWSLEGSKRYTSSQIAGPQKPSTTTVLALEYDIDRRISA